jgi:hypothetical protein
MIMIIIIIITIIIIIIINDTDGLKFKNSMELCWLE